MTAYWDFRRILNVDPDNIYTCVGTAKSYGRECRNRVGVSYRQEGSQVLREMDETKSYSKALANLEDLADLLLCKQQHNNHKKPHLNQINEVSKKWYAVAKEEYVSLKEAERAAERRAARELASMREAAQLMRDELQRERDNMTTVEMTDMSVGTTPDVALPEDDPFVVKARNNEVANPPTSREPSRATEVIWPVVPLHAPSKKIPVFSDKQQENPRQIPCAVEVEASTSTTAPLSVKDTLDTGTAHIFRKPVLDENSHLDLSFDQTTRTAKSSRLASASGPGKRVALKDKSAAINKNMTSRTSASSATETTFAFGATTSHSSFIFEAPKQPHVETCKITEVSSSETPDHLEEATKQEVSLGSITSFQTTNLHVNEASEPSTTTRSKSFGTAVVTPPSTRYKTYLPARQQHGLMTPPESPETILSGHKSSSPLPPPKIGDYFANDPDLSASTRKITRKPLPALHSPDMIEGSGNREPANMIASNSGTSEVKSGCLSRFGLGRLREKVARDLGHMKAKVSRSTI